MSALLVRVLFAVHVLAVLQLPALHWADCPVCGRGHSTIQPGSPCSSGCAAKQRQQSQGINVATPAEPDNPKQRPPKGRHSSGKTAPQKAGVKAGKTAAANVPAAKSSGGWCFPVVIGIAAVTGGGLWAAFELASTLLA